MSNPLNKKLQKKLEDYLSQLCDRCIKFYINDLFPNAEAPFILAKKQQLK